MPDFTVLPRVGEAPRMRVEWDTRDSLNNRIWADTMATGPKAVTSAMLATHPTAGAETMMPTAGRQDLRHYQSSSSDTAVSGAPMRPARGGGPGMLERPVGTTNWFNPAEMDTANMIRDVQGVIRENNMGRSDDVSARLEQRTFQNQWMTPDTQRTIMDARLGAATALRSAQDDWRSGLK